MQTHKILWTSIAAAAAAIALLGPIGSPAQVPAAADTAVQTMPEVLQFDQLAQRGRALVEQAKSGSGSVAVTLSRYPGHYTMLTARSTSGGAEVHGRFADFLIVVDGGGTELTGGTVVDPKNQPNGEIRGTRLDGATQHVLHKGDVIHIPAGTPHQAIEAPGQTITIFVIKVEEPAAKVEEPAAAAR